MARHDRNAKDNVRQSCWATASEAEANQPHRIRITTYTLNNGSQQVNTCSISQHFHFFFNKQDANILNQIVLSTLLLQITHQLFSLAKADKAIIDIRLCPTLLPSNESLLSISIHLLALPFPGRLSANITSSIKMEVHNVIALSSQKDQTMYRKFCDVRTCDF